MTDYGMWNFVLNSFQALCMAVAVAQLWMGYRLLLELYADMARRKEERESNQSNG